MKVDNDYIYIDNHFRVRHLEGELFQLLNGILNIDEPTAILLRAPGHTLKSEIRNNMLYLILEYKGSKWCEYFAICPKDCIEQYKNETFQMLLEKVSNNEQ